MSFSIPGVNHIKDDLYEVELNSIDESHRFNDWRNPRHCGATRNVIAQGFDPIEMEKLRQSIQREGLLHPITCRVVNNSLELVAGERRARSLKRLVKENALCFSLSTGKAEPASKVYGRLIVRIREMDDKEAFRYAYAENDNAIPIGEATSAAFVKYLRDLKYSDADILAITHCSSSWLREQDILIGLDDDTFQALASGEIIRSVALELSKVSEDRRKVLLGQIRNIQRRKADAEIAELEKEEQEARWKVESAKAELDDVLDETVEADVTPKSKVRQQVVKEKVEKAAARVARVKTQKQAYTTKPAKVRDLNEAIEVTGGTPIPKVLSWAKIEKCWIDVLYNAIEAGEEDELSDIHPSDARLVVMVLEAIKNGRTDVLEVYKEYQLELDNADDTTDVQAAATSVPESLEDEDDELDDELDDDSENSEEDSD